MHDSLPDTPEEGSSPNRSRPRRLTPAIERPSLRGPLVRGLARVYLTTPALTVPRDACRSRGQSVMRVAGCAPRPESPALIDR